MARIPVIALDSLLAAAHNTTAGNVILMPEEFVDQYLAAGKIAPVETDPANTASSDEEDKEAATRQDKTDKGASSRRTK